MPWPYRLYWVLTTVPWGDNQDYPVIDIPSNTREYTPSSPEIKDVNYPPEEIGRPIRLALYDSEKQYPPIYCSIPRGCEPVYYRLEGLGADLLGGLHDLPVNLNVIGYFVPHGKPPIRVMMAKDEKTGADFGVMIDNARRPRGG